MSPSTRCAVGPRRAGKRASRRVRTAYLCAPFGSEWAFGIPTEPGPQTDAAQSWPRTGGGGWGYAEPRILCRRWQSLSSLCSLVQSMFTDIPDASVRPSSVVLGHPVLRSCGHGGTRIGTGACAVGGRQARPCGQPGWPASRTARRCRRARPRIGAHRVPVRRGGWTPSSAAVVKFGRLSRSRASRLQSYSPAGARLADLWPIALLDGGAHHGFGVRRGTPLVVVWESLAARHRL